MPKDIPQGMRVGAVSLWLLLLLSERPMYGYEMIKELEKRFSGFWKPKTGTIYPSLEKLEQNGFITSSVEFKDKLPARKLYALVEKGNKELSRSMAHWTKMTEVLENYREMHESIVRHRLDVNKNELATIMKNLGSALREEAIDTSSIFKTEEHVIITPKEPLRFKFVYAKENQKLEIHIEIEWEPGEKNKKSKSI
jgi:PadR family transcriptional regulator PadR